MLGLNKREVYLSLSAVQVEGLGPGRGPAVLRVGGVSQITQGFVSQGKNFYSVSKDTGRGRQWAEVMEGVGEGTREPLPDQGSRELETSW